MAARGRSCGVRLAGVAVVDVTGVGTLLVPIRDRTGDGVRDHVSAPSQDVRRRAPRAVARCRRDAAPAPCWTGARYGADFPRVRRTSSGGRARRAWWWG